MWLCIDVAFVALEFVTGVKIWFLTTVNTRTTRRMAAPIKRRYSKPPCADSSRANIFNYLTP